MTLILRLVIRFLISLLCAFGLALAPATANAAAGSIKGTPGCTMAGHMPAKPADHSKMDCCTPACQMSAPAAMISEPLGASKPLLHAGGLLASAPAKELASVHSSGLDPPPRHRPS